MTLAILSSRFPCGNNEPFLGAELEMLAPMIERVIVAPLRPSSRAIHETAGADTILLSPLSPNAALLAMKTVARAPRASREALVAILRGSGGWRAKLKNLVVFPRALALAERFREERVSHVHAYWLSTPATAAYVIAHVNGVTWSSSAHRWDIFERNMIPEKAASARFVRVISERGRAALACQAPAEEKKFVVVRLGTALAESVDVVVPERREFRLLCAAAFRPVKGHATLLAAFAAAHEHDASLRLTLCGEGPLENVVRAKVRALPCSHAIAVRGYVKHAHLLRELREGMYDAVVLASIDDGASLMEGVPSILIEAASLSIPCVATRSGAICELLDDETAFLAEPGDARSLTRAILAATSARERLSRASRAAARARALHDPHKQAAELVELFGVSA